MFIAGKKQPPTDYADLEATADNLRITQMVIQFISTLPDLILRNLWVELRFPGLPQTASVRSPGLLYLRMMVMPLWGFQAGEQTAYQVGPRLGGFPVLPGQEFFDFLEALGPVLNTDCFLQCRAGVRRPGRFREVAGDAAQGLFRTASVFGVSRASPDGFGKGLFMVAYLIFWLPPDCAQWHSGLPRHYS